MPTTRFFPKPLGPFTLAQVAEIGRAGLERGDPKQTITEVASLDLASEDAVSFFTKPKPIYMKQLESSHAAAVFVEQKQKDKIPPAIAILVSEDPQLSHTLLARALYPIHRLEEFNNSAKQKKHIHTMSKVGKGCKIGKGVVICKGARIGKNVVIGENTVIEQNVEIGDSSVIGANSTISYAIMGKECVIGNNVSIGSPGFGFVFDPEQSKYIDIPHLGVVLIEDGVHIGDGSTVARGSSSNTSIGRGTRIDNLVQIAHNVRIGQNCAIAAQAGIAGSTIIGNFVQVGGQSGFSGHIEIGDGAMIAAQSGVARSVRAKEVVAGTPAIQHSDWRKLLRAQKYLVKNTKITNSDNVVVIK
jgi:UDP-3-O-[3-hydroxymyristoyl] glucosamine N-acyltransferase